MFISESSAESILTYRSEELKQETGNRDLHTEWQLSNRSRARRVRETLWQPIIMLVTQPIIQAVAILEGLLFGLIYAL